MTAGPTHAKKPNFIAPNALVRAREAGVEALAPDYYELDTYDKCIQAISDALYSAANEEITFAGAALVERMASAAAKIIRMKAESGSADAESVLSSMARQPGYAKKVQ